MTLLLGLFLAAAADPGARPGPSAALSWGATGGAPAVRSRVAVAEPGARPCRSPTDDCDGTPLALGDELVVTAVGDEATSDGRVSRWVAVERAAPGALPDHVQPDGTPLGWLRADQLSAAAWRTDLNGDGAPEVVVARFSPQVHGEVLVAKPGAGLTDQDVQRLDLGQAIDIDGPQTEAQVTVLPATQAGLPLVRFQWLAREMCGSGDHFAYASYAPAQSPQLRLALRHNGSGGDAPIWWETTVAFSPAARTATVTSRSGEDEDDGSSADAVHTSVTHYDL